MTPEDLKKKHKAYDERIDDWNLFGIAYEGGRPFIEASLPQNPRESETNWQERVDEGICFNYNTAIVDLFHFYTVEKSVTRELGGLENDTQWEMFSKDADLSGTNFSTLLEDNAKLASAFGAVGVLINKFGSNAQNAADEINKQIYPYCATYTLPNIYDWRYRKNPENGRPELEYLKLYEGDGKYMVWTLTGWEIWRVEEKDNSAVPEDSGPNTLNEIPFVWFPNIKGLTQYRYLGLSDIKEISRITASIIRNLSAGDEIIKFAAFPMMRKPMVPEGKETADESGATAIQEFNPEHGEGGKPDWMETVVGEPIEAILAWIDRKADEIYRAAHLSGVHGQRKSNNEVSSGLALRYEFQQLNAVLSKKSNNLTEAELNIIRLWLKWQGREEVFEDVSIMRSKSFSVDDLSINLDNCLASMKAVVSDTFKSKIQEYIVKQSPVELTDQELEAIRGEIAKGVEKVMGEVEVEDDEEEDLDLAA